VGLPDHHPDHVVTTARRALVITGTLLIGYGLTGAAASPGALLFLAAVLIGHDAVLLPVLIGVGAVVTRRCPRWLRPAVSGALMCAAAVSAIALPLILSPAGPSVLPGHYGRGLLLSYAAIAVVAAVNAAISRRAPSGPGG
jgi:hypothetical protein